jgi:hypothetical protein
MVVFLLTCIVVLLLPRGFFINLFAIAGIIYLLLHWGIIH